MAGGQTSYQVFDYRAVNKRLGLRADNHYGLKSLNEESQKYLSLGFNLYFQAPDLYLKHEGKTNFAVEAAFHRSEKRRHKPLTKSLSLIKAQIKRLKTDERLLQNYFIHQWRQRWAQQLKSPSIWQKLLTANADAVHKQSLFALKENLMPQAQLLAYPTEALIFIIKQILPKLVTQILNAYNELQRRRASIPLEFFKNYEHYLQTLLLQLCGGKGATQFNEFDKVITAMYERLRCYAQTGHDDVLLESYAQLKDKDSAGVLTKPVSVPQPECALTAELFADLHQNIIYYGGERWRKKLLELPWFQSVQREYPIAMEHRMANEDCVLLPQVLAGAVPKRTIWPEWLFYGTSLRYWFFRHQFMQLAQFNQILGEIKDTVADTGSQTTAQCWSKTVAMFSRFNQAEAVLLQVQQYAQKFRLNWLMRFIFPETEKFLVTWKKTLSAQQQSIKQWRIEFAEKIANATKPTASAKQSPITDLTKEQHVSIMQYFAQCREKCENTKPEYKNRLLKAEQEYSKRTDLLSDFIFDLVQMQWVPREYIGDVWTFDYVKLRKRLNLIGRYIIDPRLQQAFDTLSAILLGEFNYDDVTSENIAELLVPLVENEREPNVALNRLLEIVAQNYLLPRLATTKHPSFQLARLWAPVQTQSWWQSQALSIYDFMLLMLHIFVEADLVQLDEFNQGQDITVLLDGVSRRFSKRSIVKNIALFYQKVSAYPQYAKHLQNIVESYLEDYTGAEEHYAELILTIPDVAVYHKYAHVRLHYLIANKQYAELAESKIFRKSGLTAAQSKQCEQLLQQHCDASTDWDPALLSVFTELRFTKIAQDYRFNALKQLLSPKCATVSICYSCMEGKDFQELENAYGAHHLDDLVKQIEYCLDHYEDNEHAISIIEKILSPEFMTHGKCSALQKKLIALQNRVAQQRNALQIVAEVTLLLEEQQYQKIYDKIMRLYVCWQTATEAASRELYQQQLQVIVDLFVQTIKNQVSTLHYDQNVTFYTNVLKRLPHDLPTQPDKRFLELLCQHQHLVYLTWYDEGDRKRFAKRQLAQLPRLQSDQLLTAVEIEELAVTIRLRELESKKYSNNRSIRFGQWHACALQQLNRYYLQCSTADILIPFDREELYRCGQIMYYWRCYQTSDPIIRHKLDYLHHCMLLRLFAQSATMHKNVTNDDLYHFLQYVNTNHPDAHVVQSIVHPPLTEGVLTKMLQIWFCALTMHLNPAIEQGSNQLPAAKSFGTNEQNLGKSFCLFTNRTHAVTDLQSKRLQDAMQQLSLMLQSAMPLATKLHEVQKLWQQLIVYAADMSQSNDDTQRAKKCLADNSLFAKTLQQLFLQTSALQKQECKRLPFVK